MLLSEKPQYRNDQGHFDTVVSPTTTSITDHHRNLATESRWVPKLNGEKVY